MCARHPRFRALSRDAQNVYMVLLLMGRDALRTLVEEAPSMEAPRLAVAMDELYAADLLRVEEGVVLIDDLRNDDV